MCANFIQPLVYLAQLRGVNTRLYNIYNNNIEETQLSGTCRGDHAWQ